DYAERRASWAIQPPSRISRRRMWLSSYQDSVARLIALGLTSGPRAMTDARTAALTRTAVTLAAMTVGESPARHAAASMSAARARAAQTNASAYSADSRL